MRRRASVPPSGDTPANARAALGQATTAVLQLAGQLVTIEGEIKTLLADHASVDPPVVAKVAERGQVRAGLAAARTAEANARDHLRQTLVEWLRFDEHVPFDEATRLGAAWPIVLFPVRIETRFDLRASPVLLVRIYPDDISIDTHELALTDAESAAGQEYWKEAATGGQKEAWRKLLLTYPSTRAAWIVREFAPPSEEDDRDFHLFLPPRSSSWTRPAIAQGMPDRFHVFAYRGDQLTAGAVGNPVDEPLAVSLDPSLDASDANAVVDVSGHGLEIDRELAWTVDFNAAVDAGMAVRIPLQPIDVTLGFDRLFVVGVRSSAQPSESAAAIANLLDSQHYTAGLSFVRQGTPTHNTSDARSPFPPPDPGGEHSFPIERGASLRRPGSNGMVFANALGLRENVVDHIENADLREQPHARAFNDALWPGTFGYYIRQMFDLNVDLEFPSLKTERFTFLDTIDSGVRAHFVEYVRGIAALPPLRVGRRVYSVLPVSSLARWKPDGAEGSLDHALVAQLRTLLGVWSANADTVPHIGRSNDVDADLVATLGMEARSRRVRVAQMIGPTAHFNLLTLLGIPPDTWERQRQSIASDALTLTGFLDRDPLIAWMSFGRTADLFVRPLVAEMLSEENALDPNYIHWIRTASVDTLRRELLGTGTARPNTLLYHVLRYAALTEYDRLASVLTPSPGGPPRLLHLRPDEELRGFDVQASARLTREVELAQLTAWERLNRPANNGTQTRAEYLLDPARDSDGSGASPYRQSLAAIENLPTAELERLFTATLDTCSHRLDAWITSLASKRLANIRARFGTGAHWGAYGWVENVKPVAQPLKQTLPDGRETVVQSGSGGYVQAPTMTHATAGAVLRNAHQTSIGGDPARYGIDLSSDRVRRALRLLEDIRADESLGSALGHRFERSLRDRVLPQLGGVIDSLRRQFPLVANKLADSHQPADLVAARNVVDGLRLLEANRAGTIVFDQSVIPDAGSRASIDSALKELADTIDAISDLFTAESVFQSMRGNTAAAAASLDAVAAGMRPPELECIEQPRSGTALAHRFAIVLGGTAAPTPLWTSTASPRSTAEPFLDGWIGSLLGDPSTIRCRVNQTAEISLANLHVRPIDFYFLALDAAETVDGTSELDVRIASAAGLPSAAIDHAPWADRAIRSFPEAIEIVRAIRALIAASRPLRPEDLVATADAETAKTVAVSTHGRAAAARMSLDAVRNEIATNSAPGFDVGILNAVLVKASQFGIKGLLDARVSLADRAQNALREIEDRLQPLRGSPKSEDEVARAVFGPDFVLLPAFTPSRSAELAQTLAFAPTLIGGDSLAVPNWIRKAAPVRDSLAKFRAMSIRATAFGGGAAPFAVVQLPFAADAAWVALPFADEAHRPLSGRMSIVLQRVAAPAATDEWAGLVVDEWSEIIPAASEQTAVALQYDHPRAEAPQAVLVAVSPTDSETWRLEDLLACVRETLQLAKIRAADLETVGGAIGQLVPALCLASNAAGDAVSARLTSTLELSPEDER